MSDSESPATHTVYLTAPISAKARFKAHMNEQNGGVAVSRDRLKEAWEAIALLPARAEYTIPELEELIEFYSKTDQSEKAAAAKKRLAKERIFQTGGDAAIVASQEHSKRMTVSSVLADGWKRSSEDGKKHSYVHDSGAVTTSIVFKSAEVRDAFNARKRKAQPSAQNTEVGAPKNKAAPGPRRRRLRRLHSALR